MRDVAVKSLTSVMACLCLSAAASATPLVGNSFSGPGGAMLYDINPTSGTAGNARATGVGYLVGIASTVDGDLYGLSAAADATDPNSLFAIDAATGAATLIGPTGLDGITEGDLAFDPVGGDLYGLYELLGGQRKLFTIDVASGEASALPGTLWGDPSAMAFDATGALLVLETSLNTLLTVDKVTGGVTNSIALNLQLGATAGMAFNPWSGVLYVVDGDSAGTDKLYTLDPGSGVLTEVGPTGLDQGLAGLAFLPEPGSICAAMSAALWMLRRRRRR